MTIKELVNVLNNYPKDLLVYWEDAIEGNDSPAKISTVDFNNDKDSSFPLEKPDNYSYDYVVRIGP